MISVGIIGAAGYGGGELIRLLSQHPHVRVNAACSGTYSGKPVGTAFPSMVGRIDLTFAPDSVESVAGCGAVFLARDNGQAMNLAGPILSQGSRIIDLSADFRLDNLQEFKQYYGLDHASPDLAAGAVYGLPELHGETIKSARIVGNPGCYATAAILGMAPLAKLGCIDPNSIIVDGKSGISGAGRTKWSQDYHFPEANESVLGYKTAGTHRHTAEMEQELSKVAGNAVSVSFTPHIVPMTRGILATCYASLTSTSSEEELLNHYQQFYSGKPFVHVADDLPATKYVAGSNMCHIGLRLDVRRNRVTVISCIDNLGKGMAGQAVQNLNLMFGLPETAGLEGCGLWP